MEEIKLMGMQRQGTFRTVGPLLRKHEEKRKQYHLSARFECSLEVKGQQM